MDERTSFSGTRNSISRERTSFATARSAGTGERSSAAHTLSSANKARNSFGSERELESKRRTVFGAGESRNRSRACLLGGVLKYSISGKIRGNSNAIGVEMAYLPLLRRETDWQLAPLLHLLRNLENRETEFRVFLRSQSGEWERG